MVKLFKQKKQLKKQFIQIFLQYHLISMSSQKVIAVSFQAVDCGKRVSDTKKKFLWQFKIGEHVYTLQLISSALSGKRTVHLNSEEIYSQQNVFNVNFDFNHSIDGHSIRILKGEESFNSFDCRIDNRSFEYLLKKRNTVQAEMKKSEKKISKYEKNQADPFSDFDNFANAPQMLSKAPKDQFDGFGDFANFDQKSEQKKPSLKWVEQSPTQKNKNSFQEPYESAFDSGSLKKIQNTLNNEDLLSGDFSTNVYGANNTYLDLVDSQKPNSSQFGEFDQTQKSTLDKMKLDMTGKQMMNKTKMTLEETKMKAKDFFESLI